ncbi:MULTISPECIES: hypothetical protein [Cylindrospermopsis]|uniref:hypothetical protein n=1 Tax=Cylindrospermopsis TaxID=77021 RepID=UPI00092EBD10|nr:MULTISPECIES: hypothetical protein [Cylindrospermopsis]MBU6346261.1 hypothetical protein [Cyanobacteria bacterium REEB494]
MKPNTGSGCSTHPTNNCASLQGIAIAAALWRKGFSHYFEGSGGEKQRNFARRNRYCDCGLLVAG